MASGTARTTPKIAQMLPALPKRLMIFAMRGPTSQVYLYLTFTSNNVDVVN